MSKSLRIFLHRSLVSLLAPCLVATVTLGQETGRPPVEAESFPVAVANSAFQLGVTVTDSPGEGVLVQEVQWGGPAERSGIRAGDFIMAVASEPVQTPTDLQKRVRSANSANKLDVAIWRQGETITKTVAFDAKFSEDMREKAWLGVMLSMTKGGDVLIADVMPASPAAEGGIRVGDSVLRLNAENIDSIDKLLSVMGKIKAGENVEITVLRDGQESTFTVRVGTAVQNTMRWFEDHLPFGQLERRWEESAPEVDGYFKPFGGIIDRLRQEVQDLREEVQRLQKADTEAVEEAVEDDETQDASDTKATSNSVSTIDTSAVPVVLANARSINSKFRNYRNYRGGRPQVQYRYRQNYRRPAFYTPRYIYYGPPAYRYPMYVYPRTANMMYYGPRVAVYFGPGIYWY